MPALRKSRTRNTWIATYPRWYRWDRCYKCYITPTGIFGAWIAGQFPDDEALQYLGALAVLVGSRVSQKRQVRELAYDQLIADPGAFLAADKRNLFLAKDDIRSIELTPRNTWWTSWSGRGVMVIEDNARQKLRLLLREPRGAEQVYHDLVRADYPAKIVQHRL